MTVSRCQCLQRAVIPFENDADLTNSKTMALIPNTNHRLNDRTYGAEQLMDLNLQNGFLLEALKRVVADWVLPGFV